MQHYLLEPIELKTTWEELWGKIVHDNLLQVQDQQTVNRLLNKRCNEIVYFGDGNGYVFEISTKKGKRVIHYSNAVAYNDYWLKHGEDSEDYQKVVNLITIVGQEFGFEYKVKGVNER